MRNQFNRIILTIALGSTSATADTLAVTQSGQVNFYYGDVHALFIDEQGGEVWFDVDSEQSLKGDRIFADGLDSVYEPWTIGLIRPGQEPEYSEEFCTFIYSESIGFEALHLNCVEPVTAGGHSIAKGK